jgi:hypothetical protein
MMDDSSTLPGALGTGHGRVSTLDQLASIPEEEIWLQKQKSARTRRAYRLDVQHFPKADRLSHLRPGAQWRGSNLRSKARSMNHSAATATMAPEPPISTTSRYSQVRRRK